MRELSRLPTTEIELRLDRGGLPPAEQEALEAELSDRLTDELLEAVDVPRRPGPTGGAAARGATPRAHSASACRLLRAVRPVAQAGSGAGRRDHRCSCNHPPRARGGAANRVGWAFRHRPRALDLLLGLGLLGCRHHLRARRASRRHPARSTTPGRTSRWPTSTTGSATSGATRAMRRPAPCERTSIRRSSCCAPTRPAGPSSPRCVTPAAWRAVPRPR
jgi:hypothetical protein